MNPAPSLDTPKMRGLRQRLVTDLAAKGITDAGVLAAVGQVLRHAFVESAFAEKAYDDIPLPIGHQQTISQPYTVAFMTSLLHVRRGDRVLEIGTGSGYQAAILAQMGVQVYSIERHRALLLHAKAVLVKLGYTNVFLRVGDGTLGWPSHAPYNGIIVTAGGPSVPKALAGQLAVGGRLVVPVGNRTSQALYCVTRTSETHFDEKRYTDFRFVPLIGEQGWSA
jgi:protein-L-isoaspartate(D-aspartate) O-methyltransferase